MAKSNNQYLTRRQSQPPQLSRLMLPHQPRLLLRWLSFNVRRHSHYSMKLVMFDIDGTLTQTFQADEACFVQALREVFGFTGINTDWACYPHCSYSGILEAL